MNIENELDKLKRISRQEVPAGMDNRIRTAVDALRYNVVPVQWKWGFAAAAAVLLALNVAVLMRQAGNKGSKGVTEMVQGMQLSSSNELYHE
ncbi:hypothetical protein [Ferruginibacter sp. HRS2-29]|uniref:hypothetical protein n=1 Tax=Ferruginibacter sp. HRS2-29 TaxID=2487334 RepID=UPI0020CFB7CB|nr:hypothetical protein [Ferruginibacter sp. HRS2-29]